MGASFKNDSGQRVVREDPAESIRLLPGKTPCGTGIRVGYSPGRVANRARQGRTFLAKGDVLTLRGAHQDAVVFLETGFGLECFAGSGANGSGTTSPRLPGNGDVLWLWTFCVNYD